MSMSVEDFKSQYMLQWVDGASNLLTKELFEKLKNGKFSWQMYGSINEIYYAGIDFGNGVGDQDPTSISVIRYNPETNCKEKVYGCELHEDYPQQIQHILQLFSGPRPRFSCSRIGADYTGLFKKFQNIIKT